MRELAWARTDPVLSTLLPTRLPTGGEGRVRRAGDQGVLALKLRDEDLAALSGELEHLRLLQSSPDVVRVRSDAIGRLLLVLGLLGRLELGRPRSQD